MSMMKIKFPIIPSDYVFKEKSFLKDARSHPVLFKYKVKLLGGYSQNHTIKWLEIFSRYNGISTNISQSEWGPGYHFISDPEIFNDNPDLFIVFLLPQDFYSLSRTSSPMEEISEIKSNIYKFVKECEKKKINIAFSTVETDLVGFPDIIKNNSFLSFSIDLNKTLNEIYLAYKNVKLFSISNICSGFEFENYVSTRDWYAFGSPFNINASFLIGNYLNNHIRGLLGLSKKVLVSDLDNTLWGGVIGDDGPENIKIGNETPEGRIFADLQMYIYHLSKRGVFIAISSKNEKHLALEGFMNENSILKITDFANVEINWNIKSESIRLICKFLNVGLESVFFIDDNPVEREEVHTSYPEVLVPNVSDDPFTFLQALKFYDPFCLGVEPLEEDISRNRSIKSIKQQTDLLVKTKSYDEFLKNLSIKVTIRKINDKNFDRALQLNNKTNQFNFTSLRLKQDELSEIMNDQNNLNLTYSVSDKFTNYGLTGIIFLEISNDKITVNNWVMSCRIFKKTVEIAILNEVVKYASNKKIMKIHLKYISTIKNSLLISFLKDNGFKKLKQDTSTLDFQEWVLDLSKKLEFKHYVEVLA
jgi:FkbH-like protein